MKKYMEINNATILCSTIILTVLVIYKEVLESKIKRKLSLPMPIDLSIVIISTFISWILDLNKNYNIKIVGHVPTGYELYDKHI